MNSSMNSSCVNSVIIGGSEHCGVTEYWTPRITVIGGWFAVVIPTLFTIILMVVIILKQYGTRGLWKKVRETFQANLQLIYIPKSVFKYVWDPLKIKKKNKTLDLMYDEESELYKKHVIIIKNNSMCVDGEMIWEDVEKKEGKTIEFKASAAEMKRGKGHTMFLSCIPLPKFCGAVMMTQTLIVMPLFSILWDVYDVYADTYYFKNLELGYLIDIKITRNVHVINAIMVFAVLGSIKFAFLIWVNLSVVALHKSGDTSHIMILMLTQISYSIKILVEDGPELLLEYFYIDKYITESPPYFLIVKDIISSILYIIPMFKAVKSGIKQYKEMLAIKNDEEDSSGNEENKNKSNFLALGIHLPLTVARVMFSGVMCARVVGMIMQYTRGGLPKECLKVTSQGKLVQTPFDIGCMFWYDWVTITLLIGVFAVYCMTLVYAVVYMQNQGNRANVGLGLVVMVIAGVIIFAPMTAVYVLWVVWSIVLSPVSLFVMLVLIVVSKCRSDKPSQAEEVPLSAVSV